MPIPPVGPSMGPHPPVPDPASITRTPSDQAALIPQAPCPRSPRCPGGGVVQNPGGGVRVGIQNDRIGSLGWRSPGVAGRRRQWSPPHQIASAAWRSSERGPALSPVIHLTPLRGHAPVQGGSALGRHEGSAGADYLTNASLSCRARLRTPEPDVDSPALQKSARHRPRAG
jgi:hypothetical protein